jgi:hypothetical protein
MTPAILALALWAAPVEAPTAPGVVCDAQDAKKCSAALLGGQAAPFPGQLLTNKLAIDLGQKAEACDDRLKLELDRAAGTAAIQKDLSLKLVTIERDSAKQQAEEFQKALAKTKDLVEPPPWYERPPFVATVTVLVTVGVFILAVKTVELTTAK